GNKFETGNMNSWYDVWNIGAVSALAESYSLLTAGPAGWVAYATSRAGSYYEDRESRGKINRIDFGFGNHKLSSIFNFTSSISSFYDSYKRPDTFGNVGIEKYNFNYR